MVPGSDSKALGRIPTIVTLLDARKVRVLSRQGSALTLLSLKPLFLDENCRRISDFCHSFHFPPAVGCPPKMIETSGGAATQYEVSVRQMKAASGTLSSDAWPYLLLPGWSSSQRELASS